MGIIKGLLKMLSYQENIEREGFVLQETPEEHKEGQSGKELGLPEKEPNEPKEAREKPVAPRSLKKGIRPLREIGKRSSEIKKLGEERKRQAQDSAPAQEETEANDNPISNSPISVSLSENRRIIEKLYGFPDNRDIVIRDMVIGTNPGLPCLMIFLEGMVNSTIQSLLIQSLMFFPDRAQALVPEKERLALLVKEQLLPGNQVALYSSFRDVLEAVNYGDTVLFMEGCGEAVAVETKGWQHRAVGKPGSEQTIRGPQNSFTETLRTNTGLLRVLIKNENLNTEFLVVGSCSHTNVAVVYLRDLANPSLVAEVKRRIESIRTDFILDSGMLEELIRDNPYNLNPTIMATERPDKVAAGIMEGRVGIIVDGSPFVLIVPVTMHELLHTGEEAYSGWLFATFIRGVRGLAFFLSFLVPGLYLSMMLFHHEMIPTELLLAMSGNREKVPFPSLVEVLMMEIFFELIREAGLRIPGAIGTTIGIVGALVLGQAAVQANIVSPILVILVAVTGLSSLAIPSHALAFTLRVYRFFYTFLGATLGFFGIAIGLFIQTILTANLKSFGVPYLAPIGPRTKVGTDLVARLPLFFQRKLPDYLNTQRVIRQPEVSRGWLRQKDGDSN